MTQTQALEKYEWLCRKLVLAHRRQWALSHEPMEDHMQVARIGLLQALKTWTDGKGSSFSSWATTQIRWELQKYDRVDQVRWSKGRDGQRKRLEDLKDMPNAAAELDLPRRAVSMTDNDSLEAAVSDEPMTELYIALNELTGQEHLLTVMLMHGDSLAHIAKAFDITREELDVRIETLKARLT